LELRRGERIDAAFFERRIAQAVAIRVRLPIDSDGLRLIHGDPMAAGD